MSNSPSWLGHSIRGGLPESPGKEMSESISNESANLSAGGRSFVRSGRILLVLFLLSLPLVNPIVHGDGVGYYAFARAPLIDHNLDFARDYQSANATFRESRLDESGQPKPD